MTSSPTQNSDSVARGPSRRANRRKADSLYASLFNRLQSLGYGTKGTQKTVGLTSARPGEGVTTVAINLALHAASCDLNVLIVDANFTKPALHRVFELGDSPGLSDLFGELAIESECVHDLSKVPVKKWPASPRSIVRRINGVSRLTGWAREAMSPPTLSVLPLGHSVAGTADCCLRQDEAFLENVCSEFDLVIVDLPAASSPTNCGFSLSKLDGVLYVVEAERTSDRVARNCLNQIQNSGANILGAVFNKCRRRLPRWIDRKLGE